MKGAAAATGFLLLPAMALAHASGRAVLLTLPTKGFIWGAGAAVALTAALAARGARLPAFAARRLFRRPAILPNGATSWIAALLFAGLLFLGFAGPRDPAENLLPLTIWTLLWVGLTPGQVLFGDLWRDLEPWSGPVRTVRALFGRKGSIGLDRLGHWPAVAGALGFAWFEIVSLAPTDPARLAAVAGLYWLAIFILAVLEGERWLRQGEFLTVFFGYVAAIAPFWARREGPGIEVMTGLPGTQVLDLPALSPSAIAFVTLTLASVSFDGLHQTFLWVAAIGLNPLDYPGRSAVMVVNSLGLLATWAVMAGLVLLAVTPLAGRGAGGNGLTGGLCLSLLPIAAGYHIAHYLTALLTQGQYALAALSDPLGRGDDLLGLGPHWVGFGFLADRGAVWAIWSAQFAIILGAHLIAVLLAARVVRNRGVVTSHWAEVPMALLMVLYTCFGLWLLSAPAIG